MKMHGAGWFDDFLSNFKQKKINKVQKCIADKRAEYEKKYGFDLEFRNEDALYLSKKECCPSAWTRWFHPYVEDCKDDSMIDTKASQALTNLNSMIERKKYSNASNLGADSFVSDVDATGIDNRNSISQTKVTYPNNTGRGLDDDETSRDSVSTDDDDTERDSFDTYSQFKAETGFDPNERIKYFQIKGGKTARGAKKTRRKKRKN